MKCFLFAFSFVLFLIQCIAPVKASTEKTDRLISKASTEPPERHRLCLDREILLTEKAQEMFERVKYFNNLDLDNCTTLEEDKTGFSLKLYNELLSQNMVMDVAIAERPNGRYELLVSPSHKTATTTENEDHHIENTFSNFKSRENEKYLKSTVVVLGSILIGNLISRKVLYKNQHDKTLHAHGGSLLAVGTTALAIATAYYIPDKVMSPKAKNMLIGCSGFIVSTLVGLGKEVLDSRDRKKHTVDAHDFLATSIGGGGGLSCVYTVTF